MGDLGLVSAFPVSFYAALCVLIVSFGLSLSRPRTPQIVLFLHVVLFVLIIHATPAITYPTLRYSWAWKHVGIVDYILRHGSVDRTILDMGVYHNWPGFFALSALMTKMSGYSSAFPFAAWAPVFFNLLNVGALFFLFRAVIDDTRRIWLALWLYSLASWVGQDYFSPQAFALFLHLVVLGIVVRWFDHKGPGSSKARASMRSEQVPSASAVAVYPALPQTSSSPRVLKAGLLLLLVGLFTAIASSHQLTPIMTVSSLFVITLFSRNKLSSLPVIMAIITLVWIVYGATPFFRDSARGLIEEFGQVSENLNGTLIDITSVSPEQRFVALAGRFLTLAVWFLGFLGIARHLLGRRFPRIAPGERAPAHWRMIFLAGAPFFVLAANSYGGEVLFRVYLFSLPFMAFWAAHLLKFDYKVHTALKTTLSVSLLSTILLLPFLFAYYGKEQQFYFSPLEFEAAETMYSAAPPGSLIIEWTRNYPSRYRDYEFYTHVAIAREPTESRDRALSEPVETMERWMSNEAYSDAFVIITRAQEAEAKASGPYLTAALNNFQEELLRSPKFEVLIRNDEAIVFTLKDRS